MKNHIKFILIAFVSIQSINFPQSYEVKFGKPESSLGKGMTIEIFSDAPSEKISLPKINSDNLKYFSLFYSYDTANDHYFSIVVDIKEDREILYIDRNNDEDLTNDGDSINFLHTQDSVFLEFQPEADPKQILRLMVFRTPHLHDSIKYDYIDSLGNMSQESVEFWKMGLSRPEFNGKKGTFYYYDRITKKYGQLKIKKQNHKIALWDFNNNGLYNDKSDKVIVDFNKNDILNLRETEEVFVIDDIIKIDDKNYSLTNINKYGDNLTFQENPDGISDYFISSDSTTSEGGNRLNNNFWESSLLTLDSTKYNFKKLKGSYVLLNFWGEWCKPCIAEIDDLLKLYANLGKKIKFISIVKSYNLERVKQIVSEREMNWQHLILTDDFERKFKIPGYPTNILILRSGQEYLKNFHLDETIVNKYIK